MSRHNKILDDEDNADVNFLVVACLKLLRKKEINLESVLVLFKVCLASPLTSEDKETLLHAALMHTQLSIEEIEEHFLVPLKMSPENLQAVTSLFLKEVPETYDAKIIIEKIGLLLKHSNPEKISAGIVNSGFLIKLAQWENHKKAIEINTYFATHELVSQMPGSLHEACVANNIPLVKMLIAQGAPVISLREGKTPLDICLESGLVRQKLAEVLIIEYAAGIMQKIPDFLFAMGINSEAELIFLGSQFDKADPKAHFPGAILNIEDLFLKTESWRMEKLPMLVKRLEECILADQNKELASQLRKRIRFMLPPLIKTEFYGLRHLIVERFGMSIFSTYENTGIPIPDGPLEVYQKLFKNDLDIRHSNIRIRKDAQIALLTLRLLKLNEFIAIFEPYTANGKRRFNRRLNYILIASAFLLMTVGGGTSIGVTMSNVTFHDDGQPPTGDPLDVAFFILGVALISFTLLLLCMAPFIPPNQCCARFTSWPKNLNITELLSGLKNIPQNFWSFILSLPTEEFLNSPTHQNEIQTLVALHKITLDNSVEEVLGHLKRLKSLYQSHLQVLNAANLSAVDFEYQALIEPEALNQDEPLLSSHAQDSDESSGSEETGDSRLTLIVENNNNGPSLFSKANSSASINSEETAHLLTK